MGLQLDTIRDPEQRRRYAEAAGITDPARTGLLPALKQDLHAKNSNHNPGLGTGVSKLVTPRPLESSSPAEVRGVGAPGSRPRVSIVMHRLKLLDADNKWFAPKALLDGLVAAEFIPGDSESQIDYRVEQVQVHRAADVKTVIIVEEVA